MDYYTKKDLNGLQRLRKVIEASGNELMIRGHENGDLDDEYLILFVRSRAHDEETAFERARKLHEIRIQKNPEVFANFLPSLLFKGFETGGVEVLKHNDLKGRQVIVVRSKFWDTKVLTGDEVFQLIMMAGWECLQKKRTQENGVIFIFDIEGFTLQHLRYFTPQFLMKWINILIKCSPLKLKAMHFVNVHKIFNIPLSIIKMVVPRKTVGRIYVHAKPKPGFFNEFIAPKNLPEWLEGNIPDSEATDKNFLKQLYTKERENYYTKMAAMSRAGLKKAEE